VLFLMPNQQCQSTDGNRMLICWFINTSSSLKDVNITQQVVAIYPQSLQQGINLNQLSEH